MERVLRTWPLAGRREELDFVEDALAARATAGVVLAGAAGVGKSRLAAEVLARARARGRATAWAVGTHSAQRIPFGALAHLLPDTLSGIEAPQNLLRTAGEALAAHDVLGVDDAHLLDDSSAALLHHVAVAGTSFVVATVRGGEAAPDPVVALWKDGLAERLEVQPLSREETEELAASALAGPVDAATLHGLWRVTLGNPLFLREVVLGGRESGTLVRGEHGWSWNGGLGAVPRLLEVVEARLGRLDDEERAALELVAAGEPLEASAIQALAPARVVEALQRKGLLTEDTDGRRLTARLAHPLYGEVLRARTPPVQARTIRRRLAETLEAAGGRRREDLLRVATWRLDALERGSPALLVAAARRAMSVLDFRLAERLARAAADGEGGFDAARALAEAVVGQGRMEEAEALFGDLERAAGGEAERAAAALAHAEHLFWRLWRPDEAEKVLRSAEGSVTDARLRDELAAALATFRLFKGDGPGALEIVLPILERDTPEAAPLQASMTAGWALIVAGRAEESIELNERMRGPAAALADDVPFALEWFEKTLCAALHLCGRLDEAAEIAEAAHRRTLERGAEARGMHGFARGWLARTQGRPQLSLEWLREANAAFREVDMFGHRPASLGEQAQSEALAGDVHAAERTLAEAESFHRASNRMADFFVELARVWIAAARGELTRAREEALASAAAQRAMGFRGFELWAVHDALRVGERRVAPAALAELRDAGGRFGVLFAEHAAAIVTADATALLAVADGFEAVGAVLLAAEATAEAAAVLREEGRASSALAAATRARALAQRCEGARTPALAELEQPLALTPREQEIATLAASGLSNRAIAERLVLSVRTVDNHLHNAYVKLGVAGRAELRSVFGG
jgi:DNA-binding CsgD family transcriptional regulator